MEESGNFARVIVVLLIVIVSVFVNFIKNANEKIQKAMQQKREDTSNRNVRSGELRPTSAQLSNNRDTAKSEKPEQSELMQEFERALRGMEETFQRQMGVDPKKMKPATPPPLPKPSARKSTPKKRLPDQAVSAHAAHSQRALRTDKDGRQYTSTGSLIEEAQSVSKKIYPVPELKSPNAIRNAFILHQILGPPRSLRNKPRNPLFRRV